MTPANNRLTIPPLHLLPSELTERGTDAMRAAKELITPDPSAWTLAPSDFAFLWEECKRCFYLKVARGEHRPRTPMPAIFIHIDGICKRHFDGRRTSEVSATIPQGTIRAADNLRVHSEALSVPGHQRQCVLRGNLDGLIAFDNGEFGLLDFKTSHTKDTHVPLYSRQLHAYAVALEHPAPAALSLSPVTRLGLLCMDPNEMLVLDHGRRAFGVQETWIECERDDGRFFRFLDDVLQILEQPEAPVANPRCPYCSYRGEREKAP